jgi:hypothetical protein
VLSVTIPISERAKPRKIAVASGAESGTAVLEDRESASA